MTASHRVWADISGDDSAEGLSQTDESINTLKRADSYTFLTMSGVLLNVFFLVLIVATAIFGTLQAACPINTLPMP